MSDTMDETAALTARLKEVEARVDRLKLKLDEKATETAVLVAELADWILEGVQLTGALVERTHRQKLMELGAALLEALK